MRSWMNWPRRHLAFTTRAALLLLPLALASAAPAQAGTLSSGATTFFDEIKAFALPAAGIASVITVIAGYFTHNKDWGRVVGDILMFLGLLGGVVVLVTAIVSF